MDQVKNFRGRAVGVFLATSVCTSAWCGPDLSTYQLTFDEEFTSLSISDSATNDGKRWYTMTKPCCMSTSDGKLSYLWPNWPPAPPAAGTISPFTLIPGGGGNIRLSIQSPTSGAYAGKPVWIGGQIASVAPDGKGFSQQYGYFEMKAKFPAGSGTWPGFWMMAQPGADNNTSDGEIDIIEAFGAFDRGSSGAYKITLHDWKHNTVPFQQTINSGDLTAGFHTYGMLWTEQRIDFYFDGARVAGTNTPDVMKQPYYILATLGMGGGWPTDQTSSPSDMQVEHVKAYQRGATATPEKGMPVR